MKNIIVGTAGHIDHGKTALVRALTGIDTDRLQEEKRRGISIDLGFAHLELPGDLRIGFVDVPGHERFIKNMLAGVGGIDLVLLVVAADESIKPQTREHFDICRLLGITHGLVALTKTDLVDSDVLELARLEVDEFVAGSFLEGAPVVAVSSASGAGLDELRASLAALASTLPPKDAGRYFRLPVDRAFSMHGFGTVVTGTLVSGSVALEQEVELAPVGRRLRVRGIEVHGRPAGRALAGQRTAVNLAGIEPAEIARGMVLTEPGRFRPAVRIDCSLRLLASARPLKHLAPVHFHSGSAEVEAEVRLLDGAGTLQPGASAYARLVLHEPLLLLPGDRFIVRMFSPVTTIGGGVVLDTTAHRYRRGEPARDRLAMLELGTPSQRVALLVRESKYGLSLPELAAATGLLAAEIESAAGSEELVAIRQPEFRLVDREWFHTAHARINSLLRTFHRQHPLAAGMSKEELRSRELPGAPAFLLDALAGGAPGIVVEGETVRLAAHRVVLKQEEEQASSAIEAAFRAAGLDAPALEDVLRKAGIEPARARTLLQMLLRRGTLVKIGEMIFHGEPLAALRGKLATYKGRRLSVPQFKELAGVSRKYAIPLLEYLDRERVTRREGDERLVL
ncbi:MAG TPA: selenocysteine-specific translation elongation factor [Bryobacteraceae bacterium]|nr:selenocysteine-specific translation elongation factor [Bryobacteraceae bacterium]